MSNHRSAKGFLAWPLTLWFDADNWELLVLLSIHIMTTLIGQFLWNWSSYNIKCAHFSVLTNFFEFENLTNFRFSVNILPKLICWPLHITYLAKTWPSVVPFSKFKGISIVFVVCNVQFDTNFTKVHFYQSSLGWNTIFDNSI